ncbi:hypothetical protein CC86DRAFT_19771 [Ophiobolus disseminans]|uniref:Uncharacterized protein n=1 Tax=Ophiobolus disseminans TaxID=1469910 RepID=A0A6A7A2C6_9PLEO|nr:hypothetical protein CC86DRAFT_19771 [Ophiobolus disseminans]
MFWLSRRRRYWKEYDHVISPPLDLLPRAPRPPQPPAAASTSRQPSPQPPPSPPSSIFPPTHAMAGPPTSRSSNIFPSTHAMTGPPLEGTYLCHHCRQYHSGAHQYYVGRGPCGHVYCEECEVLNSGAKRSLRLTDREDNVRVNERRDRTERGDELGLWLDEIWS